MPDSARPVQIHIEDVHFAYEREDGTRAPEEALRGVSLDIRAGEHVCIVGGNGSGKSTLVQTMNALLVPTAGKVEAFGIDTADSERAVEVRRQVAMVFQHPDDQMVTSVVADDVAFGPENLGVPQPEIARRVDEALAAVGMADHARSDPAALSGGQKQRVAIAGALAMRPRALLLDEPSAMLDTQGRRDIQRIIDELNAQGITIVHVTHFMDDALRARRVIVLDHGQVALDCPPAEAFSQHAGLMRRLGLELPFAMRAAEALRARGYDLPATADVDESARALASQLAERGTAAALRPATVSAEADPRPTQAVEPAIVFEDVSFSYADAASPRKRRRARKPRLDGRAASVPPLALEQVSFTVERGTLAALVGHTGSGKSTAVELACALKVPRSGRVLVEGIDTADLDRRRELRRLVGYVSQLPERQLFAETIYEDVAFGPRNLGLDEDEVRARVRGALEAVGLSTDEAALGRSPFALSGGQQRSVALAGVLAMRQAVLVLDEPMAGLDPKGRAAMRRVLLELKAQGTTLVVVTHSMDDVAVLADHVVALEDGRVVAEGTPRAVFLERAVAEAPDVAGAPDSAEAPGASFAHAAPALPAVGEPSALTYARALARAGVRVDAPPLTLSELVEEVGDRVQLEP